MRCPCKPAYRPGQSMKLLMNCAWAEAQAAIHSTRCAELVPRPFKLSKSIAGDARASIRGTEGGLWGLVCARDLLTDIDRATPVQLSRTTERRHKTKDEPWRLRKARTIISMPALADELHICCIVYAHDFQLVGALYTKQRAKPTTQSAKRPRRAFPGSIAY